MFWHEYHWTTDVASTLFWARSVVRRKVPAQLFHLLGFRKWTSFFRSTIDDMPHQLLSQTEYRRQTPCDDDPDLTENYHQAGNLHRQHYVRGAANLIKLSTLKRWAILHRKQYITGETWQNMFWQPIHRLPIASWYFHPSASFPGNNISK